MILHPCRTLNSSLPTDDATLQAMVLAHAAELAEIRSARLAQNNELAAARAGIIEKRFEIEALKARLAKLLRATFGRSSENLRDQVEQLELFLSDFDEMLAEMAPPGPVTDADLVPHCRSLSQLPEALPRDIVAMPHLAPVRHSAACCGRWARMSPRSWTTCRDRSASSTMSAPSCPAGRARRSRKLQRQA